MPRFKVAHIREQGQDMIIIPVEDSFKYKSSQEQNQNRNGLQVRARGAGLAGKVVLVWDAGAGRMGFLAPREWHDFFSSISLDFIAMNINKEISW